MKARNFLAIFFLALFFPGCIVYSFYPLYTPGDLFPNDYLLGEWADNDSALWRFEYKTDKTKPGEIDKTTYVLKIKEKGKTEFDPNKFEVRVVKLEGHYFLDFYLEDYSKNELSLFDFHVIPVHTFARLIFDKNSAKINWFDQDWLEELIKQNKVRIHHENNGDFILLTAKPQELQKFVIKYINTEEAFKDGLNAELRRN